jgi:hypothetical protein
MCAEPLFAAPWQAGFARTYSPRSKALQRSEATSAIINPTLPEMRSVDASGRRRRRSRPDDQGRCAALGLVKFVPRRAFAWGGGRGSIYFPARWAAVGAHVIRRGAVTSIRVSARPGQTRIAQVSGKSVF